MISFTAQTREDRTDNRGTITTIQWQFQFTYRRWGTIMITMNPSPTMPNCHSDPHLPSTLRSLSLSLSHAHNGKEFWTLSSYFSVSDALLGGFLITNCQLSQFSRWAFSSCHESPYNIWLQRRFGNKLVHHSLLLQLVRCLLRCCSPKSDSLGSF